MTKRKYTKLQVLLPEIKIMLANGMSHREIEEHFGLSGERPVHHLLKQEHRREKKMATYSAAKPKGRPRREGQLDIQKELEQLRMENKLLRDFLQSVERE